MSGFKKRKEQKKFEILIKLFVVLRPGKKRDGQAADDIGEQYLLNDSAGLNSIVVPLIRPK